MISSKLFLFFVFLYISSCIFIIQFWWIRFCFDLFCNKSASLNLFCTYSAPTDHPTQFSEILILNMNLLLYKSTFENATCNMAAVLFGAQCVNMWTIYWQNHIMFRFSSVLKVYCFSGGVAENPAVLQWFPHPGAWPNFEPASWERVGRGHIEDQLQDENDILVSPLASLAGLSSLET